MWGGKGVSADKALFFSQLRTRADEMARQRAGGVCESTMGNAASLTALGEILFDSGVK